MLQDVFVQISQRILSSERMKAERALLHEKQNISRNVSCVCMQLTMGLSPWLIGTVRAEPETVISRAWVQSPDPAELIVSGLLACML